MPFLRFPLNRGKAFIRHYASSSAQRHNVGASPLNPPQFSKKKITAWFYGLPLLFRPKAQRRRKRRFYAFRLTAKRLLCGITPPLPKKVTSSHQTPLLRFSPKGEKTVMRRCCSSSAQRHGCTNCKKRSLRSVFCKTFAYHLCAVKRFSLCSKRKHSELLFAGNVRF